MLLVVAGLFVRSTQNAEHLPGFDPVRAQPHHGDRTIGFDEARTKQVFPRRGGSVACCRRAVGKSGCHRSMGYRMRRRVYIEGGSATAKDDNPTAFSTC